MCNVDTGRLKERKHKTPFSNSFALGEVCGDMTNIKCYFNATWNFIL